MNVIEFERVGNLRLSRWLALLAWRDQESFADTREFERSSGRNGVHEGSADKWNRMPRDHTILGEPPGSPVES